MRFVDPGREATAADEQFGGAFADRRKGIHADREVRRRDDADRKLSDRRPDLRLRRLPPCRANHQRHPSSRQPRRVDDHRVGRREIDRDVGPRNGRAPTLISL